MEILERLNLLVLRLIVFIANGKVLMIGKQVISEFQIGFSLDKAVQQLEKLFYLATCESLCVAVKTYIF